MTRQDALIVAKVCGLAVLTAAFATVTILSFRTKDAALILLIPVTGLALLYLSVRTLRDAIKAGWWPPR
jgi:hypothetical protein